MRFISLLIAYALLQPLQPALAVDMQDCDWGRYAIGHSTGLCLHQIIDYADSVQAFQNRRGENSIDFIMLPHDDSRIRGTVRAGTITAEYLYIPWIVSVGEKKGSSTESVLANKNDGQWILISDNILIFSGIGFVQSHQKISQVAFRINRRARNNIVKASALRDCGIKDSPDIKWTAEFLEYACRTPNNIILGDMDFANTPRFDSLRPGEP
jgi:hypothetical protein